MTLEDAARMANDCALNPPACAPEKVCGCRVLHDELERRERKTGRLWMTAELLEADRAEQAELRRFALANRMW